MENFTKGQNDTGENCGHGSNVQHSFFKEENEWINGLALGNEFSCRVKVLQFDRLYDRVVFGEVLESDELELCA